MKMSVVLLGGEGAVYATKRGRHFHEGPDCVSMLAGQIVHMCRCGDVYCGCAGEVPARPDAMSIGDAAMEGLKPCATCYPGFDELDVQLPSDDTFNHRPIGEFENDPSRIVRQVCCRCTVGPIGPEWRVSWPCRSARILGLAPREEESIS
jgi:hypothetical protein